MTKKSNHFKEVLSRLVLEVFQKSGKQLLNHKQVAAKLKLSDAEARDTILQILREEAHKGTLREPERQVSIEGTEDFCSG